jgi:transcription elongation factor SPT6
MEELRDIYQHFMLYYSHEMPAMQESFRKKERQEAREKRRQERLARRAERGENEEGAEEEDVIEEEPLEEEEDEDQQDNDTLKQASRGGTYALCRKAALGKGHMS